MESFGFPWGMSEEEQSNFKPKTVNMSMNETIDYFYKLMLTELGISEDDPKAGELRDGFEKIKEEYKDLS